MGENSLSDFINFASKGTKIKLGVLLLSAILVVTGAIFSVVALWRLYRGPETLAAREATREVASHHTSEDNSSQPYEIKGVSVGFMDKKDTRMAYAQFSLLFHCADEKCKRNLALNRAKVLDTIFEVSSEFYIEDFTQSDANKGFSEFKSKLTSQLQTKFASLAPKGIMIQDWFLN
ncbi:MAG: hypothetical protein ACKOA8_18070 [Deltaproteobacteria bacterium]|jgi:flagellar basal body-associated protein FliL